MAILSNFRYFGSNFRELEEAETITILSNFHSFGSNFGVLEEAETMTILSNFRYFGRSRNDGDTVKFSLFRLKFWGT